MIEQRYFDWLGKKIRVYPGNVALLRRLYETKFVPILEKDQNRSKDGLELRIRFRTENEWSMWGESLNEIRDFFYKPCSMLEMMVALAIRCEEDIMFDVERGNQTHVWFWEMVHALGIRNVPQEDFNEKMRIFMAREYEPDGHGGLFIVRNHGDLRQVEIWIQALWHMNDVLNNGS